MKIIEPIEFQFDVDGISKKQLDVHMALYKGYVTNFNALLQDRIKYADDMRVLSELTRRLSFEYNGIRLHEKYFENLMRETSIGAKFKLAAISSFGSLEEWKNDFQKILLMRGIGWGIVYFDKKSNQLINTFVADHEIGHLTACEPILVCDLWEHAFSVDYLPNERIKYVEQLWSNINWDVVEERM
ncbi:MAG: Fe-Mn family superoxide dismutase [bacterium]